MDKKIIILIVLLAVVALVVVYYIKQNTDNWKLQVAINDRLTKKRGVPIVDVEAEVIGTKVNGNKENATQEPEQEEQPQQEYSQQEQEQELQEEQQIESEEEIPQTEPENESVLQEAAPVVQQQDATQQEIAPRTETRGRKLGSKNKPKDDGVRKIRKRAGNKKNEETPLPVEQTTPTASAELSPSDKLAQYKKMSAKLTRSNENTGALFNENGAGEKDEEKLSGE